MRKRLLVTFIVAVSVFITGITFGKNVFADTNTSGTEYDPLVAKSYVEQEFEVKNQDLVRKITELKKQVIQLENTVNQLSR